VSLPTLLKSFILIMLRYYSMALRINLMHARKSEIPYPSRLDLARTPTPLEPLSRLVEKYSIDIHVKRDDLTGSDLTGNKVRKLEFLLADALERGSDTVLTCGAAQSNHARATAIAAAKLGLRARLFLRTRDPHNPPPPEANILLDRLVGAEIVWLTFKEYGRRAEVLARAADSLRNLGRTPYVIPEGGSNAVGAWGYVRAADELLDDLTGRHREARNHHPRHRFRRHHRRSHPWCKASRAERPGCGDQCL
jgi:D-cysteine desulfhydrase